MHKSMGEAAERLSLLEKALYESLKGGGPRTESSGGTVPAFPWAAAAGPAPAPAPAASGTQHFSMGSPQRQRVYDPNWKFDPKLAADPKFKYDHKDTPAWLKRVGNYFIGQCPDTQVLMKWAEARGNTADAGGRETVSSGPMLGRRSRHSV